jgi:threonyl-tRNA synthetase
MKYVASDSSMQRPVMVHRAIFGSFERFIGILIENFKGSFPFWLSPYQVGVVPIRVENNDYAKEVVEICRKNRIRVEADYSDKNMKDKIKTFRNYRDPYVLVLGNSEAENRTVSVNIRGNKQMRDVPLDKFIEICKKMNETHCIDLIESQE